MVTQGFPSGNLKSEILTAMKIAMLLLWVVTPCGLVRKYRRFRRTYSLILWGGHGDNMFLRKNGV